jgi:3-isopropylmalate/(R)-2-methylmalate dehydratase large subunit
MHIWPNSVLPFGSRCRSCGAITTDALYSVRKIWREHLIEEQPDGTCLLYIDRHLVDEVDSQQAFAALRNSGRRVRAPEKTLLVVDHSVPTSNLSKPNLEPNSARQIAYFAENARLLGLEYFDEHDRRQGICHVVAPRGACRLPRGECRSVGRIG